MTKPKRTTRERVRFLASARPGSEVFVAGTFNGWCSREKRLKEKDGIYAISMLLPKGRHEYKFIIDGVWCVDPECPEWTTNGLGSLNSVLILE